MYFFFLIFVEHFKEEKILNQPGLLLHFQITVFPAECKVVLHKSNGYVFRELILLLLKSILHIIYI